MIRKNAETPELIGAVMRFASAVRRKALRDARRNLDERMEQARKSFSEADGAFPNELNGPDNGKDD